MRKKIISQIMLILLIMIIGIFSCVPDASASQASFSCPSSVTVGDKISVTLNLPANHDGQCTITIKYSDGKTTDSRDIIYVKGMTEESVRTVSFDAKMVGTAEISSNNIFINNDAGTTVESNGSFSVNVNIVEKQEPQPQPQPEQPATPTTPTNPPTNTTNNNTTTNEVKFTDVNETVYTTDRVNLRKSYSTSSEKITTLAKDTKLTRTGIASNGWSRVNYNGQTAYIYTQYLAKEENQKPEEKPEEEVKFTDVNKTMYAKQNCNLRKSWSTKSDLAGYLTKGEEVAVTGTADNGWTRIKYKNQDIYVATRLLVAEKPEEEEKPEENTEEPENPTEVPVEKTELEKLQENIGVLPEVGNNIATQIYILVAVVATISSFVGLYYINKKEVK